jgi:hypothetical protein
MSSGKKYSTQVSTSGLLSKADSGKTASIEKKKKEEEKN